ncbi:MAG: cyclic nucleotide-binding domain-containing protein [Bdellovibrionales bacterium]
MTNANGGNTKVFKKGEYLFKMGDKANCLYVIQSGSVSVHTPRAKQNIEIYLAGNSQMVGEQSLTGATNHLYSAVALTETKVFEIPADVLRAQIEASSQMVKVLSKSLTERMKNISAELKSFKLERDNSPCPQEFVPKLFGTFYHISKHLGKPGKDNKWTVDWRALKSYAQKVFLEQPKKIEQVLNIFVKLKLIELQMVKNEDDPKAVEELGYIHISELILIEQFFEYFQYYFYKSGKADLLKVDETCFELVSAILKEAAGEKPDRHGACRFDYSKFMDNVKKNVGLNLNNTHFERLEQKGLYVKRATQDGGGVMLSFDFNEFHRTFFSWRVLREIDRWNEKGFVDPNEEEQRKIVSLNRDGPECPSCREVLQDKQKFCGNCGMKLVA